MKNRKNHQGTKRCAGETVRRFGGGHLRFLWARGRKDGSDIGLLAEILRPISLLELVGAEIYLSDTLGAKVDLVRERSVREDLRDTILEEVVAL